MLARVAVAAAVFSLVWCLVAGVWLWTAPVTGSFIVVTVDPAGTSTIERGIDQRSFAEMSQLGIVPLLIPVLVAGCALWAAWRRRAAALAVATFVFLVFCVLAGFSIGGAYIPAGLGLLGATITQALVRIAERQRKQ